MEKTVEVQPGRRLKLIEGDITRIRADAIVNAANGALAGGGGVDGAIHDAGGPSIMRELDKMRPSVGRVAAGQAVATSAGRLPAKWVFHAVGPVYRDGGKGEPEALRNCYRTCLRMAEEHGAGTISFPSISTGAYGYPAADAARIAVGEAVRFLREDAVGVEEILLVLFGRLAYKEHERALSGVLSLEAGG
jgi:O-acetyl-ADP-ribose deacetylase (regulator of RNase III)